MSPLAFQPILANGSNYPESKIPILPTLSGRFLQYNSSNCRCSAFLCDGEFFVQGRYALAEAIRRACRDQNGILLLPAFHCRSMIEPALYQGIKVVFYPVSKDLCPDFSALSAMLNRRIIHPAVFILSHYFGFPNAVDAARQFCAKHGLVLIEDCAHAFYGSHQGQQLGTFGNYAIASIWKFHPARDGAVLLDHRGMHVKVVTRQQQPWSRELKSWYALFEKRGKRLTNAMRIRQKIDSTSLLSQTRRIAQIRAEYKENGSELKYFFSNKVRLAGLRSSYWLMKHSAHADIIRQRRRNYLKWFRGMQAVPGISPLFSDLPEGVVPYAFPLLVDAEGLIFHLLKLAGIPIFRWEDMVLTDCAISQNYRYQLLQLPCHQDVHENELDWMINTARSLITEWNR